MKFTISIPEPYYNNIEVEANTKEEAFEIAQNKMLEIYFKYIPRIENQLADSLLNKLLDEETQ